MSTTASISPDARRRLANVAKFWNDRISRVNSDAALAQVCFDRARAAARQSQRDGNPHAMHELAEMLATWASRQEDAHARRHTQ
jgi:hypothetical protein